MNIWCISKYAQSPNHGKGFGARLYYLARGFARQGHEVTLITSDSNHFGDYPGGDSIYNGEYHEAGLKFIWIRTYKYSKTASIGRVLSWLHFEWQLFRMPRKKLGKPDVVIVSSLSIFTILYGLYLKLKYRSFLVFEVRDIWPLTMTEEGGFGRMHPLVLVVGWLEKLGYKNADLIVGTMPRLDLHVEQVLGYSRPFFCSPIGFAADAGHTVEELREDFVRQYFPANKLIVGYAGSLGITNALDAFMDCISAMQGDHSIHFVIVGAGGLRSHYERMLDKCKNVSFAPRIDKSSIQDFLRRCDVLYLSVHASKVWEYGQSMNKVVDYMLAGKPIVASYSGYMSMINEADCGLIVPPYDPAAIQSAVKEIAGLSDSQRRAMGRRGREYILKHREYDTLAAAYVAEIRKMIDPGTRRSAPRL